MKREHPKGQVALISVILIVAISLLVVISLNIIQVTEVSVLNGITNSMDAHYAAEACADDALLQIIRDGNYSGGVVNIPDFSCVISSSYSGIDYDIEVQVNINSRVHRLEIDASRQFDGENFYMDIDSWSVVANF